MEAIFLHRPRGWKDFLYVCVCVFMYVCMHVCMCVHARGRNFYPTVTKFGTQVDLIISKVQFEDGLYVYRFHSDP